MSEPFNPVRETLQIVLDHATALEGLFPHDTDYERGYRQATKHMRVFLASQLSAGRPDFPDIDAALAQQKLEAQP